MRWWVSDLVVRHPAKKWDVCVAPSEVVMRARRPSSAVGHKFVGRFQTRRRGSTGTYAILVVPAVACILSFVADLARIQLGANELQGAADAAARYAALGLGNGTAVQKAKDAASANTAD